MLKLILVMMFALAPRRPYDQMRSVAESVLAAADGDLRSASALITIHFHENGFHPQARIPYGVMIRRVRDATPEEIEASRASPPSGGRWLGGRDPRPHVRNGRISEILPLTLNEAAVIALRSWRSARRDCGTDERAFRRYIVGRCGALPSDIGTYGDARTYAATLRRIRAF